MHKMTCYARKIYHLIHDPSTKVVVLLKASGLPLPLQLLEPRPLQLEFRRVLFAQRAVDLDVARARLLQLLLAQCAVLLLPRQALPPHHLLVGEGVTEPVRDPLLLGTLAHQLLLHHLLLLLCLHILVRTHLFY